MMPVQHLLLLLFFPALPITGHPNRPALPEAIQLFQMETMNNLRQTIQEQERRLQQCESTVLYLLDMMQVQNNQDMSDNQNLVEVESRTINGSGKETKEEVNRQWNGSLTDLDIKKLYIDVMNNMKINLQSGDLNKEQKVAITGVIVKTQLLLVRKSFEVLGLQVGDRTSVETFEVLNGWRQAGNMTAKQDKVMQDLAKDTQVRMIQGLLGVLGYTAEEASLHFNVSVEDLKLLLQRPTFDDLIDIIGELEREESSFEENLDSTMDSGTGDSG